MKNILLFLLVTIITFAFSFNVKAKDDCTIQIPQDVLLVDGAAINPGDVICLLPGNKDYLLLRNIHGTEANPVTIINDGGTVIIDTDHYYGIKLENCKHIIFSGNGYEGEEYGIQIQRVDGGVGLSVDKLSTNIEINNIEIANTLFAGIIAKTDPYQGDCDNLITREKFTMYNLTIHDCYLHDIANEGMYIGSSKYSGQIIHQCNNIEVLPHVIEGVEIYDNIIERTGWDGIQVSSSPEACNIFDNLITYDSYAEEYGQMAGILLGGGAKCDCFNNKIIDGKGDGIDILGLGNMMIFNNLIVRAGSTYAPEEPNEFKHGIYVGEDVTSPSATFKIYNNTIISPKSYGVHYTNNEAIMGYIINNLITDPGQETDDGNPAYINLTVDQQKVDISNNFNVPNNSMVKFVNYDENNFDLEPNSGAVNYGKSLTDEGIIFDVDNRIRPFHTYFDAGAYECHDPNAAINETTENIGIPFPVPTNDYVFIPIKTNVDKIHIKITSVSGMVVFEERYIGNQISNQKIAIDISSLKTGMFIMSFVTDKSQTNRLLIVVR